MTELDFDSDAFLLLLSEALRAGPGSPQWHEAVRKLRTDGIAGADEYQLLVTARENLESGKEYRSVRAGPAFTQRLMAAIDEEAAKGPSRPATSTTIAIASAGIMLLALLAIGFLLLRSGNRDTGGDGTTLLTEPATSIGSGNTLPPDWRAVGQLEIQLSRNSVKPMPTTNPAATGGGLMWERGIEPGEPFAVVAGLRLLHRQEELIPQIFVTDEPESDGQNSTTVHELVWLLQSDRTQIILPGGHVVTQAELPSSVKDSLVVRLTIDQGQATIDMNGKRFWAGVSGLDPDKPRYVGIRYLRRTSGASEGVYFQWVRVNMRQK